MSLESQKLSEVMAANSKWFAPQNKRVFGDVRYTVHAGARTGEWYLLRSTYAWTDMFGAPKRLHYRINPIRHDLSIGPLVPTVFDSRRAALRWLRHEWGIVLQDGTARYDPVFA